MRRGGEQSMMREVRGDWERIWLPMEPYREKVYMNIEHQQTQQQPYHAGDVLGTVRGERIKREKERRDCDHEEVGTPSINARQACIGMLSGVSLFPRCFLCCSFLVCLAMGRHGMGMHGLPSCL